MTRSSLNSPYLSHLLEFEKQILSHQSRIEAWFRSQWHQHRPPFYGSVDMRNAAYKISPVDMNLFPGGFNNLNSQFMSSAVLAAQDAVERTCADAQSVLLIPENHTRNTFYLQNVYALSNILRQAGFEVRIGSMNPEISTATTVQTAGGEDLLLEPLKRDGDRLRLADGFSPCVVLLNNDLSGGVPDILRGVQQNIIPPLHAGWYTRRKTEHFSAFNQVIDQFSAVAEIDPWSINPYFTACGGLNFQEHEGEERLADAVSDLLGKIQTKYNEKGIADTPFVIVKADAGTYGMGVMSVKSPDEVRGLNRKNRNKMATVKEGLEVTEVIVQEGVYTCETVGDAVAEPVVYMMDRFVLGGFYRVHEGRRADENLNASGMKFIPLTGEIPMDEESVMLQYEKNRCYEQWDEAGLLQINQDADCACNRFYVYGVIARLSLLAAAIELEQFRD
ncbi:MAG: glutamate--cysteine ligase [Neisseria sp.]|nr:glutamate--cysteine ligase [Neisseria sp.]